MSLLSRILIVPLVTLVVAALLAPAPASAAVLDVTCTGLQTTTYTPGVTLTPQTVQVNLDRNFGPCVSLSQPAVLSGTSNVVGNATLSCLDLLSPGDGTRTITWNTGQTSTYTYTRQIINLVGQTVRTETGSITSGLFAGKTVVQTTTLATVQITDCLGEGVTGNSGPMTLNIT
ncbi:hypothetical protein ACIBCT_25410 [Streptosporangium sp. NPDC050855]|uniref:hypothetical protein n=1 Tax=Streptosporangium sp. NPDC050855 TaxID=3366194 RepID=UPI003788FBCA